MTDANSKWEELLKNLRVMIKQRGALQLMLVSHKRIVISKEEAKEIKLMGSLWLWHQASTYTHMTQMIT